MQNREPHAQAAVSQHVAKAVDQSTTKLDAFCIEAEKQRRSQERVLRRAEVERLTGLSRSTLYAWMKRGDFPQPVKLGARLVAWRESDINAWLQGLEGRAA